MQSAQGISSCPYGHKLIYSDKPISTNPSEIYCCNVCSKQVYSMSGRWVCNACNFSICPTCKKPPYKSGSCPNGHPMTWTNNPQSFSMPGAPVGTYLCSNCNSSYFCSSARWNCPYCNFDICSNCKKEPYMSSTCLAGHALVWSNFGYPNESYACNQCGTALYTSPGRWWCQSCQFNICPGCKLGGPPPMPAPMPAPMPMPMPQPQPYQMPPPMPVPMPRPIYGTPIYQQPIMQVSSSAPAPINPAPGPLTCPSGHGLLLSKSSSGYYNATFKCNKCYNQFPCLTQRWHCSKCKYDICKLCRPY